MTSEQKEAFLNSWFGSLPECSGHWTNGMSGNLVDEVNNRFDEAMQAYTRAVPDVPELVRYRMEGYEITFRENGCDQHDGFGVTEIEDPDGEYVLYSQAAEIIAAKDAKIKEWEKADRLVSKALWEDKVKALEAELAEVKYIGSRAQELVSDKYAGWHEDARAALNMDPQFTKA